MRQLLTNSRQIGKILTARRRALKQSQRVIAAKMAISQNRLSELETSPATLTVERLFELANLLGLELMVQDKQPHSSKDREW